MVCMYVGLLSLKISQCTNVYTDIRVLCNARLQCTLNTHYKLALFVYKCRLGATPSYLADELREPADFEARCRLRSARRHRYSHPSYAVINRRWPKFSGCCDSCLEQSSAARHIRAVTASLQALLPVTMSLCLRSNIVIFGDVNRFLTYLLTYFIRVWRGSVFKMRGCGFPRLP